MPTSRKPKTEKPDRAGDTRREGKESIPWQDDPEILARLADVAVLMNKNKRSYEIAFETKVSLATAKRDISRVRELWKLDATERIANAADSALAQYGEVIGQAWADLKKVSVKSNTRAAYMNVILRAQERMDKVTGIADPIGGPGGGPIPVELVDVEKIRKDRWKQITGNLSDMQKKAANNATKPE